MTEHDARAKNAARPGLRAGGGFTLVELLVAAAIIGIILLATQSAILLAGRAIPDGKSRNSAQITAARGIDALAADLLYATAILKMTATEVQFTVPDRDGDGSAETIDYAWSGQAGAPLLRQINKTAATAMVNNVQEFSLVYDNRRKQLPQTNSESAETLLTSYESSNNLNAATVDSGHWYGQYFQPTLPANSLSWKVTRVKFMARLNGNATGQTLVQIRTASGGKPTSTILDQATMLESSLSSAYAWQQFSFTNVSGIAPNAGLCLVMTTSDSDPSCDLRYQNSNATGSNMWFVQSGGSGSSWSIQSDADMLIYVYGTVTTPDPVAYQYWLTSVRCALRVGGDGNSRLATSIRVLNEPQVNGP